MSSQPISRAITAKQTEFFSRLLRISTVLLGVRFLESEEFATETPKTDEGLIEAIDFFKELRQMKLGRVSTVKAVLGMPKTHEEMLAELAEELSPKIDAAISTLERFLNGQQVPVPEMLQVPDTVAHLGNTFMQKILQQ